MSTTIFGDGIKLGGNPVWGGAGGATFAPDEGWRFLIQFDGEFHFPGKPTVEQVGATLSHQLTDGTFRREYPERRRDGMPEHVSYLEADDSWLVSFANLALGKGLVFIAEGGTAQTRFLISR